MKTTENLPTTYWKSVDDFYTHYINVSKPTLFKNAALDWRALSKWKDPKYLCEKVGIEQVPISLGDCEETTSGNTKSRKIGFFMGVDIFLCNGGSIYF